MTSWLQYLQTFALVTIPPIGAWIAWHQMQIARVKLQHDLFQRRFDVFDAVRRLLANICAKGNASDEEISGFVFARDDAVFLFDDDLAQCLDKMRERALRLQLTNNERLLETIPEAERSNAINARNNHVSWFGEQLVGLTGKFKPFLKLEKRQRGMRVRTGLFRSWLVASVAWVGYCIWTEDLFSCLFTLGPWCDYRNREYYTALGIKMFGAPLCLDRHHRGFVGYRWLSASSYRERSDVMRGASCAYPMSKCLSQHGRLANDDSFDISGRSGRNGRGHLVGLQLFRPASSCPASEAARSNANC